MTGSVYIASRVAHAARWRALRDRGFPVISTWIDQAGDGETGDFGELWADIVAEVARCDTLVFHAEPGDFPFKGALVEVGGALMAGKRVYANLPGVELAGRTMRPVGSWLAHSLVRRIAVDWKELPDVVAVAEPDRYLIPPGGWTCFFCAETFMTPGAAADHFGRDPFDDPACVIKMGAERGLVQELRKAQAELARLRSEENDSTRYHAMRADHARELVRAEETGYARGLADAQEAEEMRSYEP